MNKICVFAKNKNTYFANRLREEVGERVSFFDPWSDFELPEADTYIARTTGVYGNDLDLLMMKSLPAGKVINPYQVLTRFRSKPVQYNWFDQNDFPALPWISLKDADPITVEKFFRLYPEAVVKPFVGQGGWGIEAHTWSSYKSWWKKKKGCDENYLLQPLIKGASEYRYIFIKGKDPVILKRKASSGVAANFQKEGTAETAELPAVFAEVLNSLVEKSEAIYGAIDLFDQSGSPLILELNTVPGLEQAEKVSGRNLMKDLLRTYL